MPRPGRPTTERAKDFKGTLRQIIRTMSHYKLPLAAAMLFAVFIHSHPWQKPCPLSQR